MDDEEMWWGSQEVTETGALQCHFPLSKVMSRAVLEALRGFSPPPSQFVNPGETYLMNTKDVHRGPGKEVGVQSNRVI